MARIMVTRSTGLTFVLDGNVLDLQCPIVGLVRQVAHCEPIVLDVRQAADCQQMEIT